jgi:hypothetical protein
MQAPKINKILQFYPFTPNRDHGHSAVAPAAENGLFSPLRDSSPVYDDHGGPQLLIMPPH